MKLEYRYFITDTHDPYYNLAVEQYLFKYCSSEITILYLWQNDNTIVIGHNQDMYAECRTAEFLAQGGKIARRRSGGGAVYHDLGNLNYSIICHKDNTETADYKKIIISALSRVGAEAVYNGRNDILIGSRKISGTAVYCIGDNVCQHGTLLINTDINKMQYYLTPDSNKLKRNAVSSVSARVINLSEIISEIAVEKMQRAFIDSVGALPLEISLSTDNETLYELIGSYSHNIWLQEGKAFDKLSGSVTK